MHPIVALQLLTRPLAELLITFDASQSDPLDDIVQAWLRAMAPESEGDAGADPD
jgi:hypothetical protein